VCIVVQGCDVGGREVRLTGLHQWLGRSVGEEVSCVGELDGMCQGGGGEVAVYEGWTGADGLETEPEEQVFRAVAAVEGDDFLRLDVEVFEEPVAHALEVVVELFVCPLSVFEDEEQRVCVLAERVVFDQVVYQQSVLVDFFRDEVDCCLGVAG